MKRRRPKSSLASPGELERMVRQLCQDALAVYPMYRRLHALGLEPPRGESVQVSGGGESDVPLRMVESKYAASRREYARWVASEITEAARRLDRVRQGLEDNVGPTAGHRQPMQPTGVEPDEFAWSLRRQGERLAKGAE